jgi:glucokinase
VGVDIGGTKVLAGVVDEQGTVVDRVLLSTPDRSKTPDVVEDTIVEAVNRLSQDHEVAAVGVGAAGFVDRDGAVVTFAPHLSWRNEPLRDALEDRLHVPVLLDNDANTTAWAEMRFGAVRGYRNLLCVTLGTGIGGAVVVDGRVFRGAHGMAGEFGHMQVVPGGHPCECGGTGCWEQYSSGNALVRFARGRIGQQPTQLEELCGGDPSKLTGPMVTEAATAGDDAALQAFASVADWLGVGLANLVAAYDPEIVVVGGGLSAAGDLLLEPARRAMRSSLVGAEHRTAPPVVRAALGPEAGAIGAADLARQTFRSAGTRARARRRAARGTARRR